MDSFWENRNDFLTIFGLILAMFLTSQQYDFDAIAHIGLYYGVEGLYKPSFESFGQFLSISKKIVNWL